MRLDSENLSSNSTCSLSFHEIFYERADPRIRDRLLMGNPLPIVSIYAFYIIFIKYLLPRFMRDRKPIDIEIPGIVLTTVLFFNSLYFFILASEPWLFVYNWRCEPMDYSYTDLALRAVDASHLFLLSKFFYIFESVLLGLRKKETLTAKYLLVHHSSYPLVIWAITNYFPGGHATFAGFINSLTHMLSFAYRLLFVHFFPNTRLYDFRRIYGLGLFLFFWNDCDFPMAYAYLVSAYVTIISTLLIIMVTPEL
ncbi:hypothetical protein ACKWTF_015532 [Chironomus riparius]